MTCGGSRSETFDSCWIVSRSRGAPCSGVLMAAGLDERRSPAEAGAQTLAEGNLMKDGLISCLANGLLALAESSVLSDRRALADLGSDFPNSDAHRLNHLPIPEVDELVIVIQRIHANSPPRHPLRTIENQIRRRRWGSRARPSAPPRHVSKLFILAF
jgi:hypothetical protein